MANKNLPRNTPNPTTFLDLLNNTYDDADLVHMLAEATDLTSTAAVSSSFGFNSSSEEASFDQPESREFQNFDEHLDLVDDEEEFIEDFEGEVYDFEGEYDELENPDLIGDAFANKLNDAEENEQMDKVEEEDDDDDEKYLSDNFG